MGLPRSTYYDAPVATADEAEIVARIEAICEEFEAYGYRRVGAALRHQGIIVNSKKVRRLMREHDLQPRRRKRFVATTDSDHDGPIFPNLAKDVTADGPNQLWVADITYVAIAVGFVYVAVILDAWSRRVVGYAISRSIDARLTIAALKAAIRSRRPRVPLLARHVRIRVRLQDRVDDAGEPVQLRPPYRLRPPISRRRRIAQHLLHSPAVDAEPPAPPRGGSTPHRQPPAEPPHRAPRRTSLAPRQNRQGTIGGAFLRRRDRTARPPRVGHLCSAVNTLPDSEVVICDPDDALNCSSTSASPALLKNARNVPLVLNQYVGPPWGLDADGQ